MSSVKCHRNSAPLLNHEQPLSSGAAATGGVGEDAYGSNNNIDDSDQGSRSSLSDDQCEESDLDDSASVGRDRGSNGACGAAGSSGAASNEQRPSRFGPRLAPIGAPADETVSLVDSYPGACNSNSSFAGMTMTSDSIDLKLGRLKMLEEQQEDLNSSLLNLTSHFAQVQFRLKQIINAPPHLKQDLLAELEEFAGKGCVDTRQVKSIKSRESLASSTTGCDKSSTDLSTCEHEAKIAEQKRKQQELISELKDQLQELETFAYESGQGELPQSVLLEKQKAMIDQLRSRLNINLDDFNHLSNEELKKIVDSSLQRIINPAKAKEDLLFQLQSQISDLERFIDFLMIEGSVAPVGNQALCSCKKKCPVHTCLEQHHSSDHHYSNSSTLYNSKNSSASTTELNSKNSRFFSRKNGKNKHENESNAKSQQQKQETYNTVKKTMYLIQMYLLANMGCVGGGNMRSTKQTKAGSEGGEMRTEKEEFDYMFKVKLNKLSKTVDSIIEKNSMTCMDTDYFSDSSDTPSVLVNADLVKTVRRNLVQSLKALLQFSIIPSNDSSFNNKHSSTSSLVTPFNCFSGRSARLKQTNSVIASAHIWQLFLSYYEIKNGNDYVHTPARKLTDAFRLDSVNHSNNSSTAPTPVGSRSALTAKQTLLAAVYDIVSTHEPLRRNYDTQFKAFVCRGLNEKRLALWFRLVLRTQEIVDRFYSSWTYMSKAYFDDITKSLERFSQCSFNLPVNMAVQPIRNIKDAF